jgi:tetratricopeptide (TPR) repeat protein
MIGNAPAGTKGEMRSKSSISILSGLAALLISGAVWGAQTQLPFWSPLTPFETRTLQRIGPARPGDADTLLALALIASGDIRDQKSYDRIRKRVRRFVQTFRSGIGTENTAYAKGEKLLYAMHAEFFAGQGNGRDTELIDGYDSEQSRVSAIFRNGRFNCISSAMLYLVLARYIDLNVEGVVAAHHAFIQIKGENGRLIEVETTSNKGYGLTHDENFYRTGFVRFSLSRNLAVPTYADYMKRRILPPYRFIAENMNHQHTVKARMNTSNRQRLKEMIGYVDSETAASQLIRLNTLTSAGIRLIGKKTDADADRMFSVLDSVLRHVKARDWIDHARQPEIAKIRERISAVHLIMGHLHMKADRFPAARHQYTLALKWARKKDLQQQAKIGLLQSRGSEAFGSQRWKSAIEIYQKLLPLFDAGDGRQISAARENIAAAYWNWANAAREKENWATAALRYAAAGDWTGNRNTARRAISAKANAEAMNHMKSGEWDRAIEKFKTTLSRQDDAGRKIVQANIGAAYINWGNALFNQQAYDTALDKFEAALGVLHGENRNLVMRNIAAAYHNLTIPHLEAQQPEKAVAVLTSGIGRFPSCAPCKKELQDLQRQLKTSVVH